MVLFFYSVAIVALFFAAGWSRMAWGLWSALAVAFVGGLMIRYVPFPFGTLLAASGAVPVILSARSKIEGRRGGPPPGDPVPGEPAGEND